MRAWFGGPCSGVAAAAQPVEDWPLFHPASDAEAARRRAELVDSLAPVLTALQRKVLEDAPLSLPHIGESVSLSSGYDAAAVW